MNPAASTPVLRGALAASLVAVLTWLSGCSSETVVTRPVSDGKDLVTTSDPSSATDRARIRLELAGSYYERGQMSTALDQVKLALQADPKFGDAYNLRGLIYANLGDEGLAEDSFRRALQLNPRDADTMQNLGYFLCQKKRFGEANTLFDQALSMPQYRDTVRTYLTKGACLAQAGELAEAEASLMRAYEIDPSNPTVVFNLSDILYRRGEYERARFYIKRLNALPAVSNAQTLWLAARIENRSGNRAGAQEFGDQLRRRYPDSRELAAFQRGGFDE
jgi:type IV pilus assembly protein PilF